MSDITEPKYKIGDIIVYKDRYSEDEFTRIHQSKIIRANGLIDLKDTNDKLEWCYETEQSEKDCEDMLDEKDIIKKIN